MAEALAQTGEGGVRLARVSLASVSTSNMVSSKLAPAFQEAHPFSPNHRSSLPNVSE